MRDCRRFAYGVVVALFGSVFFMAWKYYVGEFPARGLFTGLVVDLVFVVAVALTLRRFYQHQLQPRREELRQQIQELGA